MIETLINKVDNAELVLDRIAAILAAESANQVTLATNASEPDPSRWALRIYTERSRPWECLDDETPVVNIWRDTDTFARSAGNVVRDQMAEVVYNIDVLTSAVTRATAEGHLPGDEQASRNAQRACRLVRNILMAATYTYLDLKGTVAERWFDSITQLQLPDEIPNVENIKAARLAFRVKLKEYSPQVQGSPLQYVATQIARNEDGQIVINADYQY